MVFFCCTKIVGKVQVKIKDMGIKIKITKSLNNREQGGLLLIGNLKSTFDP